MTDRSGAGRGWYLLAMVFLVAAVALAGGAALALVPVVACTSIAACRTNDRDRHRAEQSERRLVTAEASALDSAARFRQLAESIDEVFWMTNAAKTEMIYVSGAYEAIWGRDREQWYASPLSWLDAIHPDDRERVRAAATTKQVTGDYDEQYRIVRPDGSIRWIRDRAFPVRDASGEVIRIAGIADDITAKHHLEDQLRQAQKMESLGLLAGGVAHDFNNLLAVISSCGGLLADAIPADHADRDLVDEIESAVARATSLTRQLLAFSRKQVTEPVVLEINTVVNDTRKMLRRMVGEDIVVMTSLEPDLGHIRVDPGYLVQVLMNLAVNARDAMPRGGTLTLTTRNVHRGGKPHVLLSVADTGCGMTPEIKARVFEPFFTTKERGKGTGMGLAVVHGIVDQAGGALEVDSELGVGTTFDIVLPTVDAAVEPARDLAGKAAHGIETILLVDDDDYVRRAAARALRARGYTVVEAGDGETALRRLDLGTDLLLTDVVMAGMDGHQLATEARTRFPQLKVLYTSGYTDDAVVRHGVERGDVDLIEKPFRVHALAGKVRQVLDAA